MLSSHCVPNIFITIQTGILSTICQVQLFMLALPENVRRIGGLKSDFCINIKKHQFDNFDKVFHFLQYIALIISFFLQLQAVNYSYNFYKQS